MHRVDKFVVSHRPYAVDLSSFKYETDTGYKGPYFSGTVGAVWFNRKSGITRACIGELWDVQDGTPTDVTTFLERHEDGSYGGRCFARWDGTSFWCAGQDPEENARYLELLKPMLENFPEPAPGYSGWWRF